MYYAFEQEDKSEGNKTSLPGYESRWQQKIRSELCESGLKTNQSSLEEPYLCNSALPAGRNSKNVGVSPPAHQQCVIRTPPETELVRCMKCHLSLHKTDLARYCQMPSKPRTENYGWNPKDSRAHARGFTSPLEFDNSSPSPFEQLTSIPCHRVVLKLFTVSKKKIAK